MLVTWRGMFLVKHSLYNPSFFSDLTKTDSNRFFVKLSLLLKFIWYCMTVLSFVLIYFFPVTADSFLQKARKKKHTKFIFLFPLCLNAMKRFLFSAATQVFLAFSSIPGNLHRKCLFFSICICAMLAQSISHYCNYCSSNQAPYCHHITGSSTLM